MFSFFKKKSYPDVNLSGIGTDMHSHLLPGIDDGSTDPATSQRLIRGLEELGYRQFITTPHVLNGMYDNTPVTIDAAYQQLKSANAGMALPLRYAAEYMMDDYFENILFTGSEKILPLKDNLVLVEFSFVTMSVNYKKVLFEMQIKGYQPVLAHPERYLYLARTREIFEELKHQGCLFQMNLLSLAGYYGKPTQDLAHYLLKKNFVDLLGTDLHHARHLEALRFSSQVMPAVQSLLDSGRLLNPTL